MKQLITNHQSQLNKALPIILIVSLVLLYFGRGLFPGQIIFANDMKIIYPIQQLIVEQISKITLPFWNPYTANGDQIFAWMPLFYPPNLVASLLFPNQSLIWLYIFHFCFAGITAYLFLKQIGSTELGAILGSLCFTFNGYLILRVFAGHHIYVYASAWIPLIFLLADLILIKRSLQLAILCGLAIGLQLLIAVTQISLYTLLALSLYVLIKIFYISNLKNIKQVSTYIFLYSFAIGIGVGIGAVYWLPMVYLQAFTVRSGGLDFASATNGSLPPTHFLTLLFPNLFGTAIDQNYWGYFLGGINHLESGMYIGLLPLTLAGFSLTKYKSPHVAALLGVGGLTGLLAIGRFTPLYLAFFYLVPGFSAFRIPARSLILLCFALSMLAGLGFSALEKERKNIAPFWTALGISTSLFWLFTWVLQSQIISLGNMIAQWAYEQANWNHSRPLQYSLDLVAQIARQLPNNFLEPAIIFLIASMVVMGLKNKPSVSLQLLLVLVVIDLFWFNWRYLPLQTSNDIINPEQQKLLSYLPPSPNQGRIYAEGNLMPINGGTLFNFSDVQSGGSIAFRYYWEFINFDFTTPLINKNKQTINYFPAFNNHALRLLNTTIAFTLNPIQEEGWQLVGKHPVLINQNDGTQHMVEAYVSKNSTAMPRVWVVHDTVVITDDLKALNYIYQPDFNPANQAVLSEPMSLDKMGTFNVRATSLITMEQYIPNSMSLQVTTNSAGLLVLSEVFAPGWTAIVDQQELPIVRVNYILRGIYLPAGSHTVELYYWPPGLTLGFGITSITLLFALLGLYIEKIRVISQPLL